MAKRPAFSLIELLVVIALIGILVAIATVSYSTIQKKSRDSRRVSELKSIQQAMEQYYANTQSSYPGSCSGLSITYLPNDMPSDPQTGTRYDDAAISSCSSTSYCFCVSMEVNSGNAITNCSGTAGVFYCIRNVQ
ncbi:MAG: hypothetical protein UU25_C0001G0014 [Microgenomates group bacterium GW2011_GWB1_40_9]|nr:MAG: hypothetical protein UT26_C0005G0003 [Microgenomates group bacterium GW2011_GWC1_39_12]KKR80103.1 MAG: hypothetical protein UU25_C0001G0014 [Microgenomates group bacterium GW2011_GWB1_40_9]